MQPSLQKLQKFFTLEAEQGYSNRAVIGGFERLVPTWEAEARAENLPEDLIQVIAERLRNYNTLSPSSRQEALHGLWRRIQRTVDDNNIDEWEEPPLPPLQKEAPAPIPEPKENGSSPRSSEEPAHEEFEEAPPISAPATSKPEATRQPPAALNAHVSVLSGVGPKHAQTLKRLGLETLGDMLYYFPRQYLDFSQLKPINRLWYGEEVTVIGTVESVSTRKIHSGRMQIIEALLSDGSGVLRLTWFNQPWVAQRLNNRPHISVSGKVEQYLGRLVMNNPEWEPLDQQQLHTNRIIPVYSLTARITQRWLRNIMNQVVSYWAERVQDPLPESTRQSAGVLDLPTSLLQVHFPDSWELLEAARHRLAFDEVFLLQLGVLSQKRAWESRSGRVFDTPEIWLKQLISHLPFVLTDAQQRALEDIRQNLISGRPMNRLLQGDVGSGKTIVAALAVAMVARHGSQSAVMAPTSILAEQHYKNLHRFLVDESQLLEDRALRLLIGSTPESEKAEIRQGLMDGSIQLVIGTHALIEDPVQFSDLELVIVDEQHRFGVEQRASLRSKGTNPHLLVMTATPIPRSLALTVYGDLDLSVIDEMPPGRQQVGTYVLLPKERERVYSLINSQIETGRQAFIIYPLVEDSENSEAKAAVEEQQRLQEEVFPERKVGLLHGRMRPDEKENTMSEFRDGNFDILVATTVVEVGVDVPNATVMLIEGANRFGLAQLHQLRGRVGRGEHKSYCVLIPQDADSADNERLQAMTETSDGFILAERDLELRGPGQFLGTRQSGFSALQLASLTDVRMIEKSRREAHRLFEEDPDLSQPGHQALSDALHRFWNDTGSGDIS